ncbi:MAG: COQ9 family protein [Pseudomonadota bacterium]
MSQAAAQSPQQTPKMQLLEAILMHVPFDGWSQAAFNAAIRDTELAPGLAKSTCPRGAVDLAVAFHQMGDASMVKSLRSASLADMKIREKVTFAVRTRLEAITDKEAVRRATTLFALPHLAADGAKLLWGTSNLIWDTIGDTSDDLNWYTKRATLSGVYGATVLFWLGDDAPDHQATWDFLDRRIENVMQIEKAKAQVREAPGLSKLLAGPNWLASKIKAPTKFRAPDLPGGFGGL